MWLVNRTSDIYVYIYIYIQVRGQGTKEALRKIIITPTIATLSQPRKKHYYAIQIKR